ncbi:hypothetical protein XCR_1284 [Xanthomonas campestris pv. raphani 756C]|nr:hypothetical protein XCR_1284 [Xanthomonas campestris pv. raphani 756C]
MLLFRQQHLPAHYAFTPLPKAQRSRCVSALSMRPRPDMR